MALTEGWKRRLETWQSAISQSVYRPLGPVALDGFTTMEQLTPQQALQREFKPMPAGTPWGAKWEYGWFKSTITLPAEAAGQRIVIALYNVFNPMEWNWGDPAESVVWVNGRAAGALDFGHKEITLTHNAKPGDTFEILYECFGGNGMRNEGRGPVVYGRESVPEPGPTQTIVPHLNFGIWREDVFQLLIDFTMLLNARDAMDQNALRVAQIDRALMDASHATDMELPEAEMLESAKAGRALLKPVMECVNGSTAPVFYTFGHGHLDVEWLWNLAETERKMARTVSTQLSLMEEYPGYRFLQSQPHLMNMLKLRYPEIYERFKEAVKGGQMIVEGGMWVEADTNITGGESLIRQFIHGKRFMQDEFGVNSRIMWLPDVFGYSGAMPQIMAGCGIDGFMTAKIYWAYNGGDPFPYNNFIWEGIDGSQVVAHLYNNYGHFPLPNDLLDHWNNRRQRNDIDALVLPIGWGDGGGGSSRLHLEFAQRAENFEGLPKLKHASPVDFLDDLLTRAVVKDRYVGELYFQCHRGTYTSQAKTKKGNRKSEFALREAELWGSAAHVLQGFDFGPQTLDADWKTVLLHQFHDALPGSSIQRVYEEVERDHAAVIKHAQALALQAAGVLSGGSDGATAFNSLSWQRTALVPVPQGVHTSAPTQQVGGQTLAEVEIPACGWAALPQGEPAAPCPDCAVQADAHTLENEFLKVSFNDLGEMVSVFDKDSGREVLAGPANVLKMYKDVPSWFDAWDIDPMYVDDPVALCAEANLSLEAAGPLVGVLRLERKLSDLSTLTQRISLRRGSRRVDFETTVEWHESHKLLKVAFPVNIHANEALHEIQFGYLSRPNHASRPYDADRFEVSNHKWSALLEANRGAAVLNDCKYGLNVVDNSINLTLLKSPLAPDMFADKGTQTFTYAFYPFNGSLAESGVVQAAYDLNVPALVAPGMGGSGSLFRLDADNIIIEAVKPAEAGGKQITLRLYEALHMATDCTLTTSLAVKSAAETDMLEQPRKDLAVADGSLQLHFRPFEIKTVVLSL
ncbi:MAG: alpha-mannosidase [Anaerolineae bacterium]|nr:alpha-mannosidase [Anaerolineae bacterium]